MRIIFHQYTWRPNKPHTALPVNREYKYARRATSMAGFNGKDYMSEIPAGYLRADGSHPSDAGVQFIATLLQQTGYEYAGK